MNLHFWREKTVFITGHTGFKGSWLCLWLRRLGAHVVGYALPAAGQPNLFDAAKVAHDVASIEGDIRDIGRLAPALRENRADILIHLAAQPLVRRSYEDPLETISTNVLGTANVLEAARRAKSVRAAVIVTSDKCYELRQGSKSGYSESDRLGGSDPYSCSKACAELVTEAFRKSFFSRDGYTARVGLAVGSARAGNVIGGGDWAKDRLVPDAVSAFCRGEAVTIRQPEFIRPWQHVLDALHGYLLLAQRLWESPEEYAAAWNFGPPPSHERTVQWMVDTLAVLWGEEASWRPGQEADFYEEPVLRLDSAKANDRLNWSARIALPTALEWVVNWHKNFARGRDARALVLEDIDRFEAAVSA